MIVARGLGHPGGLLVTGGLGQIIYESETGETYVLTSTGWKLVTEIWLYESGSWISVPYLSIRKDAYWNKIWGWTV